jgi:hypothetical protein
MTDQAAGYHLPVATYVGGPLAGQTVARLGSHHPIYRHDEGRPLRPSQGELITWSPCGKTMHLQVRYYAHREVIDDHIVRHFYVHATLIEQWETERRATPRGSPNTPVTMHQWR